jgi:hypothetical protein
MPRRSKIQREKDLVQIERRYMRGESQTKIAQDVGVTQQQVSLDIKEIIKRWRAATTFDLDDLKRVELGKINNLEITYWEAWERSCEDAETKTAKLKGYANKDTKEIENLIPVEQTDQRKGQAGDPSFLRGIQWCIEKRCEILGLDAPKTMNLNTAYTVGFDTGEV